MDEKLVNFAWRMVIVALITLMSLLTLLLLYRATLLAMSIDWQRAAGTIFGSGACAATVWLLCSNRNDLVCD